MPLAPAQLEPLNLENVRMTIGERNSSWWRLSYKFDLVNATDSVQNVDALIQWVDAEGFELDHSVSYGLTAPPSTTVTFTGSDLIDVSIAHRVRDVQVRIER